MSNILAFLENFKARFFSILIILAVNDENERDDNVY